MKKSSLLIIVLVMGITLCHAQKLVPEKANPHYGAYQMGIKVEATLVFENTDTKPVLINEYRCTLRKARGGGIKVEPGKKWTLKLPIDTKDLRLGKNTIECEFESNAANLSGPLLAIIVNVVAPPTRPN